ncbi:MAG TPA: hypothetical protein VM260_27885 [Pirellula sp.]|nr:hypothetical protein [Pirellula sp.]
MNPKAKSKTRKRPKWVRKLGEIVPLIDCYDFWQIAFADEGEPIQAVGKWPAEIIVFLVANRLSITVLSPAESLLKALEMKSTALRAAGSCCRPYPGEGRLMIGWCMPEDVAALVRVVCQFEGRTLGAPG